MVCKSIMNIKEMSLFPRGFCKVRGHSTTTWTRRGGGGVSQKSTHVHPGGPHGQKFEKNDDDVAGNPKEE